MTARAGNQSLIPWLFVSVLACQLAGAPSTGLAQKDEATAVAESTAQNPDAGSQLRRSVQRMLEQAEIERSQAAQYRTLAAGADDAALADERNRRAEELEANANALTRRARQLEQRIAEYEAERERYRSEMPERLPDSLIGRWQAMYMDQRSGTQRGVANVHRDGRTIEVRYGDRNYHAVSVTRSGERFVIDLQETDPRPEPTDYRPPGDEFEVGAGTISLGLGDAEVEVALAGPSPAEAGRVRLIFTLDEVSRTLSGHWTQRVDAVTGRDDGGGGRNGYPLLGSRMAGGVIMVGREVWRRQPVQIKKAFATERQTAFDEFGDPFWRDPYYEGHYRGERTPPSTLTDQRRILFVIGQGLPQIYGEPVTLESLDNDVDYRIHALPEDFDQLAFNRWPLEDGWDLLEAMGDSLTVPVRSDDTVVLVQAYLKPGVRPGWKAFRLNGSEASWLLAFGDHSGEFAFARDIREGLSEQDRDGRVETELTEVVFRPERIYIEIRADRVLPYDNLPLLLAVNGRVSKQEDQREFSASKLDADPSVYRTPPIELFDPARQDPISDSDSARLLGVYPGDRITATLVLPKGTLLLTPPVTSAIVLEHPVEIEWARGNAEMPIDRDRTDGEARTGFADLVDGSVVGTIDRGNVAVPSALTWRGAVNRAARCANIETSGATPTDIDQVLDLPSEDIANYVFLNWLDNSPWVKSALSVFDIDGSAPVAAPVRLSTRISVGQHAAMIYLRETLMSLLVQYQREYAMSLSDDEILDFRAGLGASVLRWRDALGGIEVSAPPGQDGKVGYFWTFLDEILTAEPYDLGQRELETYQIKATREARARMVNHIEAAREIVREVEDCEVEDLLGLTGIGFGPVIAPAKTALMRCVSRDDSDRSGATATEMGGTCRRWVADRRARVQLDAINLLHTSVQDQIAVANYDSQVLVLAASVALVPVGILSAHYPTTALLTQYAFTAASVWGNLGQVIIGGAFRQHARSQEVSFARGASVVIGSNRYAIARQLEGSWADYLLLATFAAVQTGLDVASAADAGISFGDARRAQLTQKLMTESQASFRKARVELGRIRARQLLEREVMLASLSEAEVTDLAFAVAESRALAETLGPTGMTTAELEPLRFSELVESGEISVTNWSQRRPATGRPPGPPDTPTSRTTAGFDDTQVFDMPQFPDPAETGTLPAVSERPDARAWWGHELSSGAYRKLREMGMVERDDVIGLAVRNPEEFSRLIETDKGVEALRHPHRDIESLRSTIDRLDSRAPTRGREFYEQAHPDAGDPDHLHFDVDVAPSGQAVTVKVYHGRSAPAAGSVDESDTLSAVIAEQQLTTVGYFEFELDADVVFGTGKRRLIMDVIQTFPNVDPNGLPPRSAGGISREHAPAPVWVRDVDIALTSEAPGVPFAMFAELRAMQALDIGFADSQIGSVTLRNVQNGNTAVELSWLRRVFPTTPDSELIRYTSLYRHAEAVLEQAGFRVAEVRFARDGNVAITVPVGDLVADPWFAPPRRADSQSLVEARTEYVELYSSGAEMQAEIGFDIHLQIESMPR